MIDESQNIPPHWFALQIAVSDREGMIPIRETDHFLHFCSQKCAMDFIGGDDIREMSATVDQQLDEMQGEENADD